MTTIQTVPEHRRYAEGSMLKTIAWVGLLAGTLDILAAFIQVYIARGTSPEIVLRFIASGAFGKVAFSGGWQMPLAGLLFQYIIAYSFTTLFFLLYPSIKIMSKSIAATAIVYGIFIYVVMNMVVLPLTRIPAITFHLDKALLASGILIVAIGLPLSIFARKFYRS
ncbi:hypothetical protein A3860_06125 [Niastella vici]|uniref:DUF1440 domain-containing protein n=1 Tax=Niastella vici TaxID=1703345 RepID=A0A1V9FSE3_9BACT|nr:hypothetical protein [Niastella vici]OQP61285.1 hypothetical protein A3860_06125 [Niastella vici]